MLFKNTNIIIPIYTCEPLSLDSGGPEHLNTVQNTLSLRNAAHELIQQQDERFSSTAEIITLVIDCDHKTGGSSLGWEWGKETSLQGISSAGSAGWINALHGLTALREDGVQEPAIRSLLLSIECQISE